ncbi:hypothetical protein SAMN05216302_104118 [Nitrosomonas aestuarii]|uniref:Probable inorganic carbon transporter subunit DabA n=1 Tax=Nitrosomonas aestuarii TaxID=52441 RepID=A0A1I4FUM5_9PROT|nr:DUF2309 domain-containing protein [Nitrosomonas aestuarii]SFL20371.1 hypothetical protein SAMN05216302_104118 [Nitrosomonas aestuarii]
MTSQSTDPRERIIEAIDHLDHVLPGQGPIHEFVHHNTIHGFQYLPFEQALAEYENLTGVFGYQPESQNRALYQQNRITDEDLFAVLSHQKDLQSEQVVFQSKNLTLKNKDIYRVALVHELPTLSISQLNWQIEENGALELVQEDVTEQSRARMLATTNDQGIVVRQLWESILKKLDIELVDLHPENMLDLSEEEAKLWLEKINNSLASAEDVPVHQKTRLEAEAKLEELLSQIGDQITLRGFVKALSGIDILYSIRPQIIRICASVLDEGVAAWQLPERGNLGLFAAWRSTVQFDVNPFLHDLPDWQRIVSETPEDPIECIMMQLTHMEIPDEKWEGYLRRLALELPGWSGLINWRQHHPEYQTENNAKLHLADYLAIRLTLDRLWLNQACKDNWKIDARLGTIDYYFRKNLSEFMVRKLLYQGDLPEYLTTLANDLIERTGSERQQQEEWQDLADLIWTWQLSPLVENDLEHAAFNSGWRLFRLSQHLGLTADDIQAMQKTDLLHILSVLDKFTVTERSKVWLYAYEHHYREDFLQAIRANLKRGRWATRDQRPHAQIVFCIDEREESIRRQLEEINPAIETLGAAGFYGLPMNYKGLDDHHRTALCPIVVVPAHDVNEVPRKGMESIYEEHLKGHGFYHKLAYLLNQSLRRSLVLSHAVIDALAPIIFIGLLGRTFVPKQILAFNSGLRERIDKKVPTELLFNALEPDKPATPETPRLGFTDQEQVDRLTAFMKGTGLTYGFAKIVSLMAHGSTSQNNPHEAAHDCGACSGKRGGPNARLFAAMANRPKIRKLLAERGINIPDDTWFLGAEHDTCSDVITWYDVEDIPESLQPHFESVKANLISARNASAHERCRRFYSAKNPKTPSGGIDHVHLRSNDLSQVRPEYGHATNASAIVGRRSISQGVFLDRRAFLISYDPTQDPEGKALENILLAVGPVGAGINLEYYFSTIDNERFGCSTKIPHNITGLFGVMEGTSSDIRTGLPKQMVEIHEAVRLQILVEAKTEILGEIYGRQPSIQELVGGGWVLLSAIDPDTGEISYFERGVGFVPWQPEVKVIPEVESSSAYYQDIDVPLPPVLIKQPKMTGV